jgi:hypothetical protein
MTTDQANRLHTAAPFSVLALAIALLSGCGGGSGSDRVWFTDANSPQVDNLQLVTAIGQSVSGHVTGRDIDGDSLGFFLISEPSNGEVTGLPPGPGPKEAGSENGFFTYTPDPDFVGEDWFRFIANDGDWNSRQGAVVIDVRPTGFSAMFLESGERAVDGQKDDAMAASTRWLPLNHNTPEGGQALYVMDLDGEAPASLIARSTELGRITDVVAVPNSDRVFFRAGGQLYRWHQGSLPAVDDFPAGNEGISLGEFAVSRDGLLLAVIAGRQDEQGLQVFVSSTANGGPMLRVDLGVLEPVLIKHLVFDGADIIADLYRSATPQVHTLTVDLASVNGDLRTGLQPRVLIKE